MTTEPTRTEWPTKLTVAEAEAEYEARDRTDQRETVRLAHQVSWAICLVNLRGPLAADLLARVHKVTADIEAAEAVIATEPKCDGPCNCQWLTDDSCCHRGVCECWSYRDAETQAVFAEVAALMVRTNTKTVGELTDHLATLPDQGVTS